MFKDPITDNGVKKSQTGLVVVNKDADGNLVCIDGFKKSDPKYTELVNELRPIFEDGKLLVDTSLSEIRARLAD